MKYRRVVVLAFLVAAALLIGSASAARAELQKPAYAAGERWIYELRGSLAGFPGVNASEIGTFSLGLVGRVEVEIVGFRHALADGERIPVIEVETRSTGFLNGTLSAAEGGLPGTVQVTGTFSSLATELWETASYLPVASSGTTTYVATVSYIVAFDLSANVRLDATTTYDSIPAFELGVGGAATTDASTDVVANATVSFLSKTVSSENETVLSTTWMREVRAETNVTVDAGTFPVFELNQTLIPVPGLAGIVPAGGANETAYFSNSVGYYVKREAYANGTRVAEMTLQSYTHPRLSGLSAVEISLLVALPIGALFVGAMVYRWRKRKRAPREGDDARAR